MGKQLFKIIDIEDSPFKIIEKENEYYLVLGKYRLTGKLNSEEDARENAKNAGWERIIQVAEIAAAECLKLQELEMRIEALERSINND